MWSAFIVIISFYPKENFMSYKLLLSYYTKIEISVNKVSSESDPVRNKIFI